ncbi:hypothetical protein ACQ4LE_001292 [Meloidogyne hapla]
MIFPLIFITLFESIFCEDKIDKIWQSEGAITLFRRKPTHVNFIDILNISLPAYSDFQNTSWHGTGHLWFIWDEELKDIKRMYRGFPTTPVPPKEEDGVLYSGWLIVQGTCSKVIGFLKSFLGKIAKVKWG